MNKAIGWFKGLRKIEQLYLYLIILGIIAMVISKNSASMSVIFDGNAILDMDAVQEIVFSIATGILTSAIVAWFVDASNTKAVHSRDKATKTVIMRKLALEVNIDIGKLNLSGYTGGVDFYAHNYDELIDFIINEAQPRLAVFENIIETYPFIFNNREWDALLIARDTCKELTLCETLDSWKKSAEDQKSTMKDIYSNMCFGETSRPVRDVFKKLAEPCIIHHKKTITNYLTALENFKTVFEYLFY